MELLETIKELKNNNKKWELAGIKASLEEQKEWLKPLIIMFVFLQDRLKYVEECLEEISRN